MNKMNTQLPASGFNYISKTSYFESKHKSKPGKFLSVEEGRLKRTERKSIHRKSARISVFDNARNMSPLASPQPVHTVPGKTDRRRQQLQQWKEEKEKKKLEEASKKKKKPFVVGTVRAPLAFEPPPPPKPSTSGRVTRSQSIKNKNKNLPAPPLPSKNVAPGSQGRVLLSTADFFARIAKMTNESEKSFAPANATFHPPKIDMSNVTNSEKNTKPRATKQSVTFNPIINTNMALLKKTERAPKKISDARKTQKSTSTAQSVKTQLGSQQSRTKLSCIASTQSTGVLAPKDNTRNARVTRQNTKLIDKNIHIETKSINSKPTKSGQSTKEPIKCKKTPKRRSVGEVPKSESSVEERLRTPEEKMEPTRVLQASISPFVTVSRGKHNVRKENIVKIKDGLLGDDVGDLKTVDDFRNQLSSEMKRLTAISDEWNKYADNNVLPEHIQELVLAAVGQTRLLMSKKLQQFSQLVELCAKNESRPEGSVTTGDLQGFWDMVFMQVENVDMRFKKLNELRERNWVVEEKAKPTKKRIARVDKKKTTTVEAPSKIRAMIEAARKASQSRKKEECGVLLSMEQSDNKRFDAGFFSVMSPVRDSGTLQTPRSNRRASMLKDVLSSEARRAASASKDSASRAMMKASLISKSVDSPLITSQIPTRQLSPPAYNLDSTPARGILKTPNPRQESRHRKSAKTVLFEGEQQTEKVDFEALVDTPQKSPFKTPEETPVTRRRSTRTPRKNQENVEPSSEGSPPRRITRNMRRSILQEKQDSASYDVTAEFSADTRRRKEGSSIQASLQVTEGHQKRDSASLDVTATKTRRRKERSSTQSSMQLVELHKEKQDLASSDVTDEFPVNTTHRKGRSSTRSSAQKMEGHEQKQDSASLGVTVEFPANTRRRKGRSNTRSSVQMTEVH